MNDQLLPTCEIHNDVETLTGHQATRSGARGIGGGFPCQAHVDMFACKELRLQNLSFYCDGACTMLHPLKDHYIGPG